MKIFFKCCLMKNQFKNEWFVSDYYALTFSLVSIQYVILNQSSSIMVNLVPKCKYIVLTLYLFRGRRSSKNIANPLVAFNCQDLMMRAARKMLDARSQPSSNEMQILIRRNEIFSRFSRDSDDLKLFTLFYF